MSSERRVSTRVVLEEKVRALVGDVSSSSQEEQQPLSVTVAIGLAGAMLSYLWGRRRGNRDSSKFGRRSR